MENKVLKRILTQLNDGLKEERVRSMREQIKKRKREAHRVATNKYRKNNPNHREGHKNCVAAWRKNNPEKYREQHIKRKYGIPLTELNELFEKQGKVCATCKSPDPGRVDWHVDHCHTTLKVRGLLCGHCNAALGLVKDSVGTLQNMIDYLGEHVNG